MGYLSTYISTLKWDYFFFHQEIKSEIKELKRVLCALPGTTRDYMITAVFSVLSSQSPGFLDVFHFH